MRARPIPSLLLAAALAAPALFACECDAQRIVATLAELDADPDPVEFGQVPVSTVRTQEVTLTNRGTGTVHLQGLEIVANPEDFSLHLPDELVFPHAIPPGNQVVFGVRYHPQDYPEQDEGAVRITSTDRDAPEYDLLLGGSAVEPILLIQPVPVDFGRTRVMGTKPATVTILHTGSDPDPVTISLVEVTDSGDGDFAVQNAPATPLTLAPDDQVNVNLSYIPQAIDDSDEGVFTIESDAESQERIDIPLLGSSFAPRIVVNTSALNYGTVSQGANPTLGFTISNDGNDDLNIQALALSQTGSQKFDLDPVSIDAPIAPLGSVEVRVTYIADDRGDDDGTLRIDHDDPLERPVFIQLHGRTPAPDIEIIPDFITIQISGSSHTQTADIRIYNLGDEDLRITGMQFDNPDGSFAIEAAPTYPTIVAPGSVAGGPSATVTVRFNKDTATVDDRATLTFACDDPDEATVVVSLVGTYTP
jgi:hypothetical protein